MIPVVTVPIIIIIIMPIIIIIVTDFFILLDFTQILSFQDDFDIRSLFYLIVTVPI